MATEKQVAANRRNAQKSTGPRTEAGKDASSRNGFKHGVLSVSVVSSEEDHSGFTALLTDLVTDHQPMTAIECALVERLAILLWRERRLAQAERWMLEEVDPQQQILVNMKMSRADRPKFMALNSQLLVGRYQTMLSNQVTQTLRELRAEQDHRASMATLVPTIPG